MADWWLKYKGKFPGAGFFFPEENWLNINSTKGAKLMTYRFHIEIPKGLVFTFHGMYSESNEFAYLGKRLFDEGYCVLALDQEGHGKSEGKKGRIRSLNDFLQDSAKYIKKSIKRYPKVPVFIIGQSMGGALSTMLSLKIPELLSGMVLLAPALGVAPDFAPLLRKAVRFLNICCGCLRVKKFDGTLSCRNLDYVNYFEENPLNYSGKMDVGTAYSMLVGLEGLERICRYVESPVLVVQGTSDKIVDYMSSKKFFDECKSADKEFLEYDGMFHDILHEPEIFEIIEKIIVWLNERVARNRW